MDEDLLRFQRLLEDEPANVAEETIHLQEEEPGSGKARRRTKKSSSRKK